MIERVFAHQQRRHVIDGDGVQGTAAALQGVGETETAQAGVGLDVDQQNIDVIEPTGRGLGGRRARPRQRHVQQFALNSR